MRSIGIVTVGRSDFGIYRPLLRNLCSDPMMKPSLVVAGMHLSPEFGLTVRAIESEGFEIAEQIEMNLSSDSPQGIVKSMGLGMTGFAQIFSRWRPDILVVLGDRFEMYTAALSALPFKIPVAHIHGGELTEGAIDDALRHSITKLSHLHFVSMPEYADRVIQLGEEPWRVTISGAPGLDNLHSLRLLSREELYDRCGLRLEQPFLLVTFHPVTLEEEQAEWQVEELLAALDQSGLPVVLTSPNADTRARQVASRLRTFARERPSAQFITDLGTVGYFSTMALASGMVGNSSSGIIEAPSFKLPVVNVGTRQAGRIRAANVIDVDHTQTEILRGIRRAVDPQFREALRDLVNPYDSGQASARITARLKEVALDDQLIRKRFYNIEIRISSNSTSRERECEKRG